MSPRGRWLAAGLALALAGALAWVRGARVGPGREPVPDLLAGLRAGGPTLGSQQDLERVGALAYRLVSEAGGSPGTFYVQFLPRLDLLEKLRHLVHSPFHELRNLYCDVWIHSVSTYGRAEPSWGVRPTRVRPALQLPLLLFLVERLARGKGALAERLGAPLEAVSGTSLYTLPGRARVWDTVLAGSARHPGLGPWLAGQLAAYEWGWVDPVEIALWQELAAAPSRARVRALAGGAPRATDDRVDARVGIHRLPVLLRSYRVPGAATAAGLPSRR